MRFDAIYEAGFDSIFGYYTCRALDKAGRVVKTEDGIEVSRTIQVRPEYHVKSKIIGWNETMVS